MTSIEITSAADVIRFAQKRESSQVALFRNLLIIEFSFDAKWRHQNKINKAIRIVCNFLRIERKIVGGGFGCLWVALDIGRTNAQQLLDLEAYLQGQISQGGTLSCVARVRAVDASVTIIPDIEFDTLANEFRDYFSGRSPFYEWRPEQCVVGFKIKTSSEEIEVIIVFTRESGNVYSSALTSMYIARFNPGFVILFGIGGNVDPTRRNKGDVIVADHVLYEAITRVSEGVDYKFSQPTIPQVDRKTAIRFERFLASKALNFRTNEPNSLSAIRHNKGELPKVEVAAVYCSHMVVDCTTTRAKIQNLNRDHRAVEMEAAGFLLALKCAEEDNIQLPSLIIRGISDDCAKKTQNDRGSGVDWRRYAASNAAQVLVQFIDALRDEDWKGSKTP